jgi:Carboxypeptidase regulatory-like domain
MGKVKKYVRKLGTRPVVVVAVALLAAVPTAAALRLHSSTHPVSLSGVRQRATQGSQPATDLPRATKAIPGNLKKPQVLSKPTELYLRKAHSAVFDVRKLKSTVVKRERPERTAPREPATETEAPATALPQKVNPATMTQAAAAAPAPDSTFAGLDFANWGQGHPPDTNGDVGPAYYMQTINVSVGIYNKSTGTRVAAFTFNSFMNQGSFGNLCDTDNFGDPVVLYDSFEDRWIVTDFAFKLDASGNVSPQHVYECFAVSKTSDPIAGGWNFYSIETPGGLGDYPKLGVWPDGLYMSANMFGYSAAASFISPRVWAINKAQMYAGAPTVQVADFAAPTDDFTLLPANARLQAGAPPAGSPEYFVSTWQFLNALSIYKFHVDWDKISTSTFTGPSTQLAPNCWPNAAPSNAATTANSADTLAIRAMAQAQYTNLAGAESVWVSHTVQRNVSATNTTCNATTGGNASARWYQANVTGGTGGALAANVVQGATFDPEGANTFFRFMPSLAVDRAGDMAIGYTKSNSTTNPQIKYAGRLAGDPANTLGQSEQTLIDGTGSQSGNCGGAPCTRWGDYSGISLDPNGCEFWETAEYYATTGLNHQTEIGSFHFPSCTTIGNGTLSGTVTDGTNPISGATVALGSRTTTTNGSGAYSFSVPAGTYASLTASKPGFNDGTASSIAVPNGGTATRNFTLTSAAQSGCFTDNTQSTFQRGAPTNCDLTASPGNVVLASPDNTAASNSDVSPTGFGFNSTSWAGQTFTPTASGQLKRVDVELFCSGCSGTNPNITVSLRATSGGVPTGADLATMTLAGFNDGAAGGLKTVTFAAPPTVTAGTKYAFVFRSVTNRTAGTYAYTCSCVTSGFSNTNPYANGQFVTSSNSGTSWSADATVGGRDLNFVTYINPGYTLTGTFVSSLKDANPAVGNTPNWTIMTWAATTPAGTTVKFQAAGSNSQYGPFNYVGPDGTASTFFTTSGASLSQFNGLRYLRYKATLTTSGGSVTPSLSSVQVCFTDTSAATSPTSLSVASASGTYGGTTTLSATLTSSAVGVSGKTVAFTLNGNSVGTASTNGSGVATLSGVSLAGVNAGSYASGVGASFAGGSSYDPSSGSSSLTVAKTDQTINVTGHAPATAAYNATFFVAANATSSLAIAYSSSGSCSNAGTAVTITSGTGTCTVKYDQPGNGNYNAAPQVTETVTAQKANQTINVSVHAPASQGYNSGFVVSATATSALAVAYSSGGSCSNIGSSFTMTSGTGTCTVKYDQAGDSNYNTASQVTESVTATKGSQAINITTHAPAEAALNDHFTVAATGGGSGNAVTFSSSGSCTNTGDDFTITASSGTCTVKYDQAGDSNYDSAPQVRESVTAKAAHQTITVVTHAPANAVHGTSFDVAATADSALAVTYSSAGGCTNAGSHFTMRSGTTACTVKYDQPGNANYTAAPQVIESVTAQKANQTITVTSHAPASAIFGTSFSVAATASSGLGVSISGTGPCGQTGSTFTATTGTGTCAVTYNQAGDANYNAAPQVTETVTAQKANQTITVTTHAPASAVYKSKFTVAATATSGLPVSYSSAGSCTNVGATFTVTKPSGTCTVKYDQAGDANYNAASQLTESVVAKPQKPKRALVTLCYRRHTVHVTAAKAKKLRKHGAKSGACKKKTKKK